MVIFYCFNVLKNANVRPLVSQKGPLFPTGNDIDRMHRIGKPKNNGKPRPVIIKFVRYNCRKKGFFWKKLLKDSSVSITESLTAFRMKKLTNARETFGFRYVWTVDGRRFYSENGS